MAIIDELRNQGIIDALTHGTWQLARRTRNKAIHMNPPPSLPEVKQLIEVLDLSARETGKSYAYQELSPYAILLTGPSTMRVSR